MKKSQLLQFLLALVLGPIGLFYSNSIAAIGLLVSAIALSSIVGLVGSVVLWVISIFVGVFTTQQYNAMIEKEEEEDRMLRQTAKENTASAAGTRETRADDHEKH